MLFIATYETVYTYIQRYMALYGNITHISLTYFVWEERGGSDLGRKDPEEGLDKSGINLFYEHAKH